MEKRLPQTVVENFKRESIVAEPGSDQDDRIRELVSQSLSTAIREYETETSKRSVEGNRPSHSRTSTDSRETIKVAAPSEAWDCEESRSSTSFSRSVNNEVGGMGSPKLLNSRSTTTTDSGYSSSAPALSNRNPFALDAAGIGGIMEDYNLPVEAEHAQRWFVHDDILDDIELQGIGSLMGVPPSLSAGSASGNHQYLSNVPLLPEPPSFPEYDWAGFPTTGPIYSFSESPAE